MNDLTTQPPKLSIAYSATDELSIELAKMLALVAPITMTVEQQELWLRAAVDALEDIRPLEVRSISAELRRHVTRPNQIVPKIAELVAQRRSRPVARIDDREPLWKIEDEGRKRRARASNQQEIEEAATWERQAKTDAGYSVPPLAERLSREELDNLTPQMLKLGLNSGFLTYRDNQLVETT